MRNVLQVLSNPKERLENCHICLNDIMLALPDYVSEKVNIFKQNLKVCDYEPFMDYEKRAFDAEWCHVISANHTQKLVE